MAACWAAFALLAAVAWAAVAPPSLGGGMTFGAVDGSSMEPALHAGDLVVLRPRPSYRAGDVVAYRGPGGRLIIHRVVGETDGGLLVRGDANAVADGAQPRAGEVVGRLWLKVPDAGRLVAPLRPPLFPLACAALALLLVLRSAGRRHRPAT